MRSYQMSVWNSYTTYYLFLSTALYCQLKSSDKEKLASNKLLQTEIDSTLILPEYFCCVQLTFCLRELIDLEYFQW